MIEALSNLIKRALITKASDDTGPMPIQQVSYNGKVADTEIVFPYGLHANLSAGNTTLCTVWAVEGQEDYRVAMGYTPGLRPKGLAEGEVVLYHPLKQSKVHLRADGDIDITSVKGININVAGDANIDVIGTTTLKTGQFDVDSPLTNLGLGGAAIARVGDSVQVTITSGSSAGTANGTITSGGDNNSI